ELASQAQHLNIDAAIEYVLVQACGLEQVLPAERSLRCLEEGGQQGEFAFAEGDRAPGRAGQAPCPAVELPSAELVAAPLLVARWRAVVTPQYGADSGEQFAQPERLGDEVVGAELQRHDAVNFAALGIAGHDHRDIRARADLAQQVQSVAGPGRKIQNDQPELAVAERADHVRRCGADETHVVLFEVASNRLLYRTVFIDQQNVLEVVSVIESWTMSN